ncbi:MAG: MarC family protein [Flavobacteriaceae bacterium]|nr:MarC family protein [Flavobacteriaceae bacterium]
MNIDILEIAKASMILFAVIDIVGSLPIVVKLKANSGGEIESGKASLVAGSIMILFLFLGEKILEFIGIDAASFGIAGSFILFFMALEMVLGINLFKQDENTASTASIVPLAFPMIAGAGSMTSILSLRAEYESVNIAIAIVLNIAFVFLVLKMSGWFERKLGKSGIAIIEKVFGIILLAIAVKLFTSGVKSIFY